MAEIINGRAIAQKIIGGLKQRLGQLDFVPTLCDIVVGTDPVSLSYVKIKQQMAEEAGLVFFPQILSENISEQGLLRQIQELNIKENMCGLIIQLPLPEGFQPQKFLDVINPTIDVDCLGKKNKELFYSGHPYLIPPTAGAILEIMNELELSPDNKQVLVVGQGELVGKPITHLLKQAGWKVITADQTVTDLKLLTRQADVIISGTGQAALITGDMIKPGAIIVDAGTSESGAGIAGDVDFDTASKVASVISPVPGGVGPVTVGKLLENVVQVAERQ
jgi:methylenetetrahydrofolate dehydrogenase (NADP+) / methenyltetrahydrofolate cyclohydrolase